MINFRPIYVIQFVALLSVLAGQSEPIATTGQAIDGSTGLILNSAPSTLPTGHLRIGLFSSNKMLDVIGTKVLPYVVCLGLSERIAISSSSMALGLDDLGRLQRTSFGLKANLFMIGRTKLAFSAGLREIERVTKDGSVSIEESVDYSILGQSPLGKSTGFFSLGAKNVTFPDTLTKSWSPIVGAGLVLPINQKLFGFSEFQIRNNW